MEMRAPISRWWIRSLIFHHTSATIQFQPRCYDANVFLFGCIDMTWHFGAKRLFGFGNQCGWQMFPKNLRQCFYYGYYGSQSKVVFPLTYVWRTSDVRQTDRCVSINPFRIRQIDVSCFLVIRFENCNCVIYLRNVIINIVNVIADNVILKYISINEIIKLNKLCNIFRH